MRQDVTCRVFAKKKESIEKLMKTLDREYVVTQSATIQWNEKHEDFETWLYLLHKDSLGRNQW